MSRKKTTKEDTKSQAKAKDIKEIPSKYKVNWEYQEFSETCEIDSKAVEDCGLDWSELAVIYADHLDRIAALDSTSRYIVERLQKSPRVHSVRSRVKNPAHLVRKVIRKRTSDNPKDVRYENYRQEITDLVGIRALHLYKEDWLEIHKFITSEWETAELPTAYIREGDRNEWKESYEANGCKVEVHPRNYRSVHYLIKCAGSKTPTIAEIQVRTLFEEAWSEIDHQINYPVTTNQEIVRHYLELFNRYAGSADEMGSFLPILADKLESSEKEAIENAQKIEDLIKKSNMDDAEKEELREALRKTRTIEATPITIGSLVNSQKKALESSIKSMSFNVGESVSGWGAASQSSPYLFQKASDLLKCPTCNNTLTQLGYGVAGCVNCSLKNLLGSK